MLTNISKGLAAGALIAILSPLLATVVGPTWVVVSVAAVSSGSQIYDFQKIQRMKDELVDPPQVR